MSKEKEVKTNEVKAKVDTASTEIVDVLVHAGYEAYKTDNGFTVFVPEVGVFGCNVTMLEEDYFTDEE